MKPVRKIEPPFKPLLCSKSIEFFDAIVSPDMTVFEFGSGASTLWLAQRARHVISVEHDEEWFREVKRALREHALHADVWLITDLEEYPRAILDLPAAMYGPWINVFVPWINVVFVDGFDRTRNECIAHSMGKITPGGWLVVDDSQWAKLRPGLRLLSDWKCTDFTGERTGRSDGKVTRGRVSFFRKPGVGE